MNAHETDVEASQIEVRRMTVDDIDALHAFHVRTYEALPDKRFIYRRDRDYFENAMSGGGLVVGACLGSHVVGFCSFLFRTPSEKVHELCPFLPAEEHGSVAVNGSTLVDERVRGKFIGAKLQGERMRWIRSLGYRHSVGIVFIKNRGSLTLAFRQGRRVRGTLVDEDGPNLVTYLDLVHRWVPRPGSLRRVDLSGFPGHREAIADGLCGHRLSGDTNGRYSIEYASFVSTIDDD